MEPALSGAPPSSPFGLSRLGPVLMHYGNDAVKQRYMPPIARGEEFWCQGYSEQGAGSDLAGVKSRATREADHYIVNGKKIWTTQAQRANFMFCLVRTNPDVPKQQGITFLLIDMATPGIEIRPITTIDGHHHPNEVFITKVRKQFGTAICNFQILQHRLVDMFVEIEQSRSMVLMADVSVDSEDAVERRRAVSAAKAYLL